MHFVLSTLIASLLKGNAAYLKKKFMDENDALSEYNTIPKGVNPGGDGGDVSPHVLTWGG